LLFNGTIVVVRMAGTPNADGGGGGVVDPCVRDNKLSLDQVRLIRSPVLVANARRLSFDKLRRIFVPSVVVDSFVVTMSLSSSVA